MEKPLNLERLSPRGDGLIEILTTPESRRSVSVHLELKVKSAGPFSTVTNTDASGLIAQQRTKCGRVSRRLKPMRE